MSEAAASDPFRLPRVSRAKTVVGDNSPPWAQWLAHIGFVLLIVLALAGPFMTINGDELYGQIREGGYVTSFALAFIAIRPWRHPERLLTVPWPLLLALGWCWFSLTWAIEPMVGLRRLLLTSIVLWSIFALVRELDLQRSVAILRILLAALLIANFAAVLAWPDLGVHAADDANLAGNWRGIMGQKNWAGMSCAITILLFAFDTGNTPVPIRIAVGVAAAAFLVMTASATSQGMCVAALLVGGLFAWRAKLDGQRQLAAPGWAALPLALLAVVIASIAFSPELYLQMVRDPTGFTGRYEIWTALIRAYADRPLLGFGFGCFWDLGPHGPVANYTKTWVAELSQGHNGYLDLLVTIGAPGLLLVLFATLNWPLERLLRGGNHPARVLAAAMLLFCLGHNFTETTLFDRDGLGQVFLMLALALLWNATGAAVHGLLPHAAAGPKWRRMSSSRRL